MREKGLGRGLSALIPGRELTSLGTEQQFGPAQWLDTDSIKVNQYQPRTEFDAQSLANLASSIKEKGIIQPVVVRRSGDGYELICGERRLRAARQLGMAKVPALVKDVSDAESLELSLIENVQREDLNPIEQAKSYQRLINEFGLSQEDLSKTLEKDRSSIANTLRLLRLPVIIQNYLAQNKITVGHAMALLSLASEPQQLSVCERIIKNQLSVRETEQLTRGRPAVKKRIDKKSDEIIEIEEILQRRLATQVKVKPGRRKGTIEIEYYSVEDLNRIVDIMR